MNRLSNLIKALTIFVKYDCPDFPIHCEDNEFMVFVDPDIVSAEDKKTLKELGFHVYGGTFISFVFLQPPSKG